MTDPKTMESTVDSSEPRPERGPPSVAAEPSPSGVAGGLGTDRLRALLDRPISTEEIAENTRAVAALPASDERLTTSLLLAAIGGERLGFDVSFARRVVPTVAVHRVPHRGSEVFGGICAIGGELMLAGRLDRLLGLEQRASEARDHRMLVVGEEGRSWVLTLDRVDGVQRFDAAAFLPPPATVARAIDGVTRAIVRVEDGSLISILDGERLLRALERGLA